MSLKIAINGMGVVGRELLRTLIDVPNIEITMLNDLVSVKNLEYLIKYDTIYHDKILRDEVTSGENSLFIRGKEIPLYQESNLSDLPIGYHSVDLVIDCTGTTTKGNFQGYFNAGAKKVMACYYIGNDVPSIVYGVNHNTLTNEDKIISFATMETQVLANVLKPINVAFGVESAIAKAVRSYTNAQPSIDSYNKSFAQGRAAAWNISPVGDSFARHIGLAVPELNGKVIGNAYRVPVINGSVVDINAVLSKKVDTEGINNTMKANSGVYEYNEDPLCSSDALSFASPVFLANSTFVNNFAGETTLASLSIIYDSVRGYCYLIKRFLEDSISAPPQSWLY